MAYKIRWKQSDYIKLGKAISDFNKKISFLSDGDEKAYLPRMISYQEAKNNVRSRGELNKLLRALKSFKKEGAEDLYVTEGRLYDNKMGKKTITKRAKTT